MTFGDIILCDFPLTSGSSGKIRPALVLFDLGPDVIICRVTSVLRTEFLDVLIQDWQSSGLLKPSVARLDRLVTMESALFLRQLGRLSARDLDCVRQRWNSHLKL